MNALRDITAMLIVALAATAASAQMNVHSQRGAKPAQLQTSTSPNALVQRMALNNSAAGQKEVADALFAIGLDQIAKHLDDRLDTIAAGGHGAFIIPLSAAHTQLAAQHSLRVAVSCEAQPVGVILAVKVELIQNSVEVGPVSNPLAVKELTEGVDEIDRAILSELILRSTHALASEYAGQ